MIITMRGLVRRVVLSMKIASRMLEKKLLLVTARNVDETGGTPSIQSGCPKGDSFLM